MYELDPAHSFSVPRSAWQKALKKTKINFELLTDTSMLLMEENGIRGEEICHAIHHYAKANNKYKWKIMVIIIKNYPILSMGMETIFTDGQCHESCL